ncbi:MAG: hypothetical protein ACLFS8_02695 [Clostridia bacterium]
MRALGMILEGFYTGLYAGIEGGDGRPSAAARDNRVVDISRRARDRGIFPGMSVSEVELRFPDVRVFELDPRELGPDAEILAAAWAEVTPEVEMIEGNRFFLGLAPGEKWEAVLSSFLGKIPGHLGHWLWIGVGPGRLTAEVALNYSRNQGCAAREIGRRRCIATRIDGSSMTSFLSPLSLAHAPSVPDATVAELRRLGVSTFGDLAVIPQEVLENHFGPGEVTRLSRIARGQDATVVAGNYPPPRKLRERGIENWHDAAIKAALRDDIEGLAKEMRDEGLVAGGMKLWLLGRDRKWDVRSREFTPPRGRRESLESVLLNLWVGRGIPSPSGYRVELFDLGSRGLAQISFMENTNRDRRAIEELIDDLGRRYSGRAAFWGEAMLIDRRERMLELWDPLRRRG